MSQPTLKLVSVEKIWDEAPHNAFTDLIRYNGQWVCSFREAPAHAGGVQDSRVRVLVSDDARTWRDAGALSDPRGDIRDAKLSITPDGELMVLTSIQVFGWSKNSDPSVQKQQSMAFLTKDLKTWDGPYDVAHPNYWTWGIAWRDGVGYSIGYHTPPPYVGRLYTTRDGRHFEALVEELEPPAANESVIVFDDEGMAHCLLRCGDPAYVGRAQPPYTDWTWKKLNQPVAGPDMILLPNGRLLGGGRLYRSNYKDRKTWLFWIDTEAATLEEALQLPSDGDNSYPGMVWHDGLLYVSYYSSHEGKTSIYFARVAIDDSGH